MRADLYQKIANDILPPELKEAGDKLAKQVAKRDYAEEDLPRILRGTVGFFVTLACLFISGYLIVYFGLDMARGYDETLKALGIIALVAFPSMYIFFYLLTDLIDRVCLRLVKKRVVEIRDFAKNNPDAKRAAFIIIDTIKREKEDLLGNKNCP